MPDEDPLYPEYEMRFVTGDTWKRTLLIDDPDPDSPDPDNPVMIPRNLTGYSFRAQVRKDTKPVTPITATLEVTGTGTDGAFANDGLVYLHLPPLESQQVLKASGWDLEETNPSGDVQTILGGPVDPTGDYTR